MADDILGGGGGSGGEPANEFLKQIPEQFRADPALKDIKSMDGLVSSYLHAQSMVGRDKIALPGKDATDDDWKNVFKSLGRPENPDDYAFDAKALQLPEGFQVNDDFVKDFKSVAHKHNLTKRQAEGLLADLHKDMLAKDFERHTSEVTANRAKWQQKLREELGGAYDEQIQLANNALNLFGGDELKDLLRKQGLLSHPNIVKTFAKLGELTAEGISDIDNGGGSQFKVTADQAKVEIKKLQGDAEFMKAYQDEYHPNHKNSVEKMRNLYKVAYPGNAAS